MHRAQYQIMHQVEDTHFWYVGMRMITSSIFNRLNLPKNSTILDAGCGSGAGINFLSRFGKVKGIDISPLAIRLCQERGLKSVRIGSVNNIPYKNTTFDLLTCFDVLGHKNVHPKKALDEFCRVLKPEGTLLIRVAAYSWLSSQHDIAVQNQRRYSRESLYALFSSSGLEITYLTYANSFLFPLLAMKRILSSLFSRSIESDTKSLPSWLNRVLLFPLFLESILLKHISLPFGLSLIVVARKSLPR